ncbi:hypothetical protein HDU81_008591 [Chytriomyces hyalinus]|nr:hypothetical protein HDU81_008591 [Chytriomyces hyalinus]
MGATSSLPETCVKASADLATAALANDTERYKALLASQDVQAQEKTKRNAMVFTLLGGTNAAACDTIKGLAKNLSDISEHINKSNDSIVRSYNETYQVIVTSMSAQTDQAGKVLASNSPVLIAAFASTQPNALDVAERYFKTQQRGIDDIISKVLTELRKCSEIIGELLLNQGVITKELMADVRDQLNSLTDVTKKLASGQEDVVKIIAALKLQV